ncbi:MAG: hemolysin family protein [marine benthic group bacterium]|nr:hemolysin family protein [Gemmatimonadota bacterium]
MNTLTVLLSLGGLVLLSGFFSGSEIALFSVPLTRARALAEEGVKGAKALYRLKSNPERLLVTLLIGNNVVNIGAASIATYAATEAFGSAGVGIATGGMTLLVLFFGEIIPKTYAAAHALRLSLFTAPLFLWLTRLALPIVLPFEAISRLVLPRSRTIPSVTESEIRALTQLGHQTGAIEEHERELIERAFALDNTRAWEVMTPRTEIFAWPADRKLSDIADELDTVPFSRIPLHGDSMDEIVGVLYVRDAYEALKAGKGSLPLGSLGRQPLFVPHSVSLVQLLGNFRSRRIHMGVVVDEHGGTDGVVTLEDILEELVGEIVDERDLPEDSVVRVDRNEIVVDAGIDIKEINQLLGTRFPVLEHRTINGVLLDRFGRVPEAGEALELDGVTIEVLEASETQVQRARIRSFPDHETGQGEESATAGRSGDSTATGREANEEREFPRKD